MSVPIAKAFIEIEADLDNFTKSLTGGIKKSIGGFAEKIGQVGGKGGVFQQFATGMQAGVGLPGGTGKEATAMLGGMAGKLGMVAGSIGLVVTVLGQIKKAVDSVLQEFAKSSPALQGTLMLFQKAMLLFFKPFGDFLSSLLRPLAIWLLKASIAWIKFTKDFGKTFDEVMKPVVDELVNLGTIFTDTVAKDIKDLQDFFSGELSLPELIMELIKNRIEGMIEIGTWLWKNLIEPAIVGSIAIGEWLGENIPKWIKGVFDFAEWIRSSIATFIEDNTFDFGYWIGEQIGNFVVGVFDIGEWLLEFITSIITGEFDIGAWLLQHIKDFIKGIFQFGQWLLDNILSFFSGLFDFGQWLLDNIGGFITGVFNLGTWLSDNISSFISGVTRGYQETVEKQVGGPIAEEGNYYLHRGEKVVSATQQQTGRPTGKQAGGPIGEEGTYYLHRGERVDASTQQPAARPISIVNHIAINNPVVREDRDIEDIADQIANVTRDNIRRRVSYGL